MRRLLWILAALVVAMAVVGTVLADLRDLGPNDAGPPIAANGTIVYEANGNIRMVNPDGTDDGRVIGERGDVEYQVCPRYSPDGTQLAHHKTWPDQELVVNNVDAHGHPAEIARVVPLPLVGNLHVQCGHWSPSGHHLTLATADAAGGIQGWLVVSTSGLSPPVSVPVRQIVWGPTNDSVAWIDGGNIVIAEPTGHQVRIIETVAPPTEIAWSPDGSRFAFIGVPPQDDQPQLFLIGSEGTGEVQVTTGDHRVSHPAWSPDGTTVAFVVESCRGQMDCDHRIALSAGGEELLPEPHISGLVPAGISAGPSWSPDGRSVLYAVANHSSQFSGTALIISAVDGHSPLMVTEELGIASYDWQRR